MPLSARARYRVSWALGIAGLLVGVIGAAIHPLAVLVSSVLLLAALGQRWAAKEEKKREALNLPQNYPSRGSSSDAALKRELTLSERYNRNSLWLAVIGATLFLVGSVLHPALGGIGILLILIAIQQRWAAKKEEQASKMSVLKEPKQKSRDIENESESYIEEAALYCLNKHHEIATQLVGSLRLDQIPLQNNFIAIAESICCFLHFVDRSLTESAPRDRQERMDKLVRACIAIFASLIEKIGGISEDEAYESAYDQFIEMYNERGEEYASVGQDWFKKVLLRYATHLVQILNEDDPSFQLVADPEHSSFKMVLNAERLFAQAFGDMMKSVPSLFKP